ncbi:hypothetical protein [Microbulbifer sp. THAF38]|uniref:hypothetical protein n=1 Tax=Microbulbifer sp. THAF38 TaxID=2587856 RepID=UPI00126835FA|nr:hypothetical protein [Microbulbifer sp. THAF38]QFT56585.1 hypothetical protein FIU95_18720 [Microbulbifer sp. THAF38]
MAQLDNKLKKALEQRLEEWLQWSSAGHSGLPHGLAGSGNSLAALMSSGGELIRSTAPQNGYQCPRAEEVDRCLITLTQLLPGARKVVELELYAGRPGFETQALRAKSIEMSRRQYVEYLNTGRWILIGMLFGKVNARNFKQSAFEQPEPRSPRIKSWHAQ